MINTGLAFVVEDIEDGYREKLHKALVCMPLSPVFSRHTGGEPHFMDEPTIGVDVAAKQKIYEFLRETNREKKTTILLTSHDMKDLESICQRLIILEKGKILFDDPIDQLLLRYGGGVTLEEIIIRLFGHDTENVGHVSDYSEETVCN